MIKKTLLLISLCTIVALHSNSCCAEVNNPNQQITQTAQQHYLQTQYYYPNNYYQNYIQQIYIPSGTPVRAHLDETIDADNVREGDEVFLRVLQPVRVKGKIVIPANTAIVAQVMDKANNCIFGVPGRITIGNFKIRLNNGNILYLNGRQISHVGKDRFWANFIAFFFFTPLIFVKGEDGIIHAGYQQMLYTDGDAYITF